MGQLLHGSARTTEAVRRAIQNSQESIAKLAKRYNLNPATVAKWKRRDFVHDAKTCLLQAGGPETAALPELIAGRGSYLYSPAVC